MLEYCPHGSLKHYLRRFHPNPPPIEEAVAILTNIGQALYHAHQKGVVHRDLKPANILFNAQGEGVLSDFDIEVPRDRQGIFEPQLVKKGQTRLEGFDEKILALYARGMTTRDIQAQLQELYRVDVSPTLISNVTEAVMDEVRQW